MIRICAIFLLFAVVGATLFVSFSRTQTAVVQPTQAMHGPVHHQLKYEEVAADHVTVSIDGHRFATLELVEAYLLTLPKGDVVSCHFSVDLTYPTTPEGRRHTQYASDLEEFGFVHHIEVFVSPAIL